MRLVALQKHAFEVVQPSTGAWSPDHLTGHPTDLRPCRRGPITPDSVFPTPLLGSLAPGLLHKGKAGNA